MPRRGGKSDRFEGQILGIGSTSGVRVVVGRWHNSPLGTFADCMVALPDGRRLLLAPDAAVAEYVSTTYQFDDILRVPVAVTGPTTEGGSWVVEAGPLRLHVGFGARTALGQALRLVPPILATAPALTLLTDPIARVVLQGVRTRGTAGGSRREFYGARDMLAVTSMTGEWKGRPLGSLAPLAPEPGFGFSSTPATPSVVAVTTTIRHAR